MMASIVILTFNALELTKLCVDSILENTSYPYELIFVDNASSDGTVEYLEKDVRCRMSDARLKIIKNKKNLGFAAGCNQGILASKGDYIVLLNSDTIVPKGWLKGLVEVADRDETIGIVGPLTNNTLPEQMIKTNYTMIGEMYEFARRISEKNRGMMKEMDHLTGFCMLIKREVINNVGLFDENYGIGTFEDTDYCWRTRLAGYRLILAEDVFIHHKLFGSFEASKIDIRPISRVNMEYFNEKKRINTFKTVNVAITGKDQRYEDGYYRIDTITIKREVEGVKPIYFVNVDYSYKGGAEKGSIYNVRIEDLDIRDFRLKFPRHVAQSSVDDWSGLKDLCVKAIWNALQLKLVRFPQVSVIVLNFEQNSNWTSE
ncbi:MAG: glycosyltransferase family 2 protein [Deltaproteobacteria bacterium]|nr:glycosyltransferase family 2 protein [Deltaproteobacteria bacterium]